jgi:hypothetical protein
MPKKAVKKAQRPARSSKTERAPAQESSPIARVNAPAAQPSPFSVPRASAADKNRSFLGYLWHKKYTYREFLEPLLALPFGYAALRLLEGQYNTLTVILVFVLVLIYLPTIIVMTEGIGE